MSRMENDQLSSNENQPKANNGEKEKNDGKANEQNGNTVAKALFAIFLIASVAFGVTGVLLNPWLLCGLISLVPAIICACLGFTTSSKSEKMDLGGGNLNNQNDTISNTVANAIEAQKGLNQSELRNGIHNGTKGRDDKE